MKFHHLVLSVVHFHRFSLSNNFQHFIHQNQHTMLPHSHPPPSSSSTPFSYSYYTHTYPSYSSHSSWRAQARSVMVTVMTMWNLLGKARIPVCILAIYALLSLLYIASSGNDGGLTSSPFGISTETFVESSVRSAANVDGLSEAVHYPNDWQDITPPLSRQTLGHISWVYLHTMAALYPEEPTDEEQQHMNSFIRAFSFTYPCRVCSAHFRELLAEHPPIVSSRSGFAAWVCSAHNLVNERLGKDQFDCSNIYTVYPNELPDCGCDAPTNSTTKSQASATIST